ncbi:MAG: copper chaperone PCu(A)C [Shimia sp.]|nr:copper chaperone PCu(A)C [Shimia sp.]MCP4822842.1 copper chaperone PCu(A)C [Shimia sp.]|mmetsp:Transcript_18166/g.28416  ORF Transcript_18166/g.28416 Transcript_18166/m.28416 type:complete len:169 (-) Transcript_18166:29-535(-)
MSFKTLSFAAATAVAFALPAFAESTIAVNDAYARVSSKMAKAGAAFMVIENTGTEDDQLVSVTSDVAKRTELHTHQDDGNGNMKMMHVKEGFAVPAGGEHALARGGDHVMFMGLTRGLEHGDVVNVTLTFEKAGDVMLEVPVDLERKPDHGAMKHGDDSGHGEKKHDH